jgi:hypothetical protein
VKIEGKSVHLLGEPMLNNCGPSGNPPNTGATMTGVGQGNLEPEDCPGHDLKWEELTPEGEKARKDRKKSEEKKRKEAIRKHEYDMEHGTGPGDENESFRLLVEATGAQEKAEFEDRVADEAKAKWTNVKYWCTKCKFKGEIDAITEDGTIKESKGNGKVSRGQIEKYQIIGPAMLGAAFKGIHVAMPGDKVRNAKDSIKDQGLGKDCDIQPH